MSKLNDLLAVQAGKDDAVRGRVIVDVGEIIVIDVKIPSLSLVG